MTASVVGTSVESRGWGRAHEARRSSTVEMIFIFSSLTTDVQDEPGLHRSSLRSRPPWSSLCKRCCLGPTASWFTAPAVCQAPRRRHVVSPEHGYFLGRREPARAPSRVGPGLTECSATRRWSFGESASRFGRMARPFGAAAPCSRWTQAEHASVCLLDPRKQTTWRPSLRARTLRR